MRYFLIIKRSWPAGVIYSPKPMFIPFAVWPSFISALCDCEKVCVFLFVFIHFANASQVTGVCSLTICQGYLFLASAKIQNCAGQKACSRARAQVRACGFTSLTSDTLTHCSTACTKSYTHLSLLKGRFTQKKRIGIIYSPSGRSKSVRLFFQPDLI